jgi:DNA-binding CsgD family transcriptional regulator
LWRAVQRLGITGRALEPAESAGLIEIGRRVRFRHPLVRSAVYRAASADERRRVHRALAEATDGQADPDRRAWHLAEAAAGPDEDVAAELERAAGRAQARGGLAAAAAFLERAVALTREPSVRADRALAAAQIKVQAGALDAVESLLALAVAGPSDELREARADQVRAQLAYVTQRGSDAPALLLTAARRLESIAPDLARATYLEAFLAAALASWLAAPGGSTLDVARAASRALPDSPTASDLLVDGLAADFTRGYRAGLPILRRALRAFGGGVPADQELRGILLAFAVALHVWGDDHFDRLHARWVSLCREAGALSDLPIALNARALVLLLDGDLTGAESLIEEVQAATDATGLDFGAYGAIALVALRGDEADALTVINATIRDGSLRGEGSLLSGAEWANAVLHNGLGRFREALAPAQHCSENRLELLFPNWALAELIEAAARSGMRETAADAYRRLAEVTGAAATDWALGVEARCRALLSDGEVAEGLYREAIQRLRRTRVRVELARAHLLYGEWLRRERRRIDAREQLRTAFEMFSAMGVDAFAGRAERELLATGECVRTRSVETRDELTAQEAQVARLARDGLSNAEIGERLFISQHTVAYHLRKVFKKLDISSRNQLAWLLPDSASAGRVA